MCCGRACAANACWSARIPAPTSFTCARCSVPLPSSLLPYPLTPLPAPRSLLLLPACPFLLLLLQTTHTTRGCSASAGSGGGAAACTSRTLGAWMSAPWAPAGEPLLPARRPLPLAPVHAACLHGFCIAGCKRCSHDRSSITTEARASPPAPLPPLARRRSVLPPTAVRPALRNGGSSRSQLDQLATAAEQEQATPLDDDASSTAGLSDISAAAATTPREPRASRQKQQATPQQPQRPGPAAADGSREGGGGGGGGGGGSGKKKRSSWWRRLYRPKHLQWQDYRIGGWVAGWHGPHPAA